MCHEFEEEDQFYDRKSECMTCTKIRNNKYRAKHRSTVKKSPYPNRIDGDRKQCNSCDQWLSFIFFSHSDSGQGKLQTKCKPCTNRTYRAKYAEIKRAEAEKDKSVSRIEKHWNFT